MLKRSVHESEEGFASLVIGLILVLVLGLLTVGFAQLSRHEQVQALDSQLSSEAYYAAESGINDAIYDIETTNPVDQISTATPNVDSGNCLGALHNFSSTINSADDVYYTCLIVNLNPPQLQYGPVNPGTDQTVVTTAINPTTHGPMTNMTFSWNSYDGNTTFPALSKKFEPSATWTGAGYPGVIELSITPLDGAVVAGKVTMSRDQLINQDFTVYLYPSNAAGNSVTYEPGDTGRDGDIVPGDCSTANTPYNCSVTINGINTSPTGQYLIHFYDLYDASNVEITGTDGAGPVDFTGGQAQIDATGRAQDVLKRLAVTIPLGTGNFPNDAIQVQNLCKKMEAVPGPGTTTFWDPTAGAQSTTKPCDLEL